MAAGIFPLEVVRHSGLCKFHSCALCREVPDWSHAAENRSSACSCSAGASSTKSPAKSKRSILQLPIVTPSSTRLWLYIQFLKTMRSSDSTHHCRSPTPTMNGRDLTSPTRTRSSEHEYSDLTASRAWKNVNFSGSLSKFPVGRKLKTIALYGVAKGICFLENVALKSLNYHCVHIDQLGLIQPTSIRSHSTCKQLHRRSVPRYRSLRKNETLSECKTDGSGKSSPRSVKFSRLIRAQRTSKICILWALSNSQGISLLH